MKHCRKPKQFLFTLVLLTCRLCIGWAQEEEQFVLTPALVEKADVAIELSKMVFDEIPSSPNYSIQVFRDTNDQTIVAKAQGTCYAAFRGTMMSNLLDILQNISFLTKEISGSSGSCRAEAGFVGAYFSNHQDEFEAALRECASSCENSQCPVVLTGHSQGGAIATVSSVVLADLDPVLITFGQIAAIRGKCPPLDQSTTYLRFERSCLIENTLTYDVVPYIPNFAKQRGHQLMLGSDGDIMYVGKNTHKQFYPKSTECHDIEDWYENVKRVQAGVVKAFNSSSTNLHHLH